MHEYAIVGALVDRVTREAEARGATVVRRLHVALGELSGVEPDLLASAFGLFCEGTVCGGADLVLSRVPARWECTSCGVPRVRGEILSCPTCGVPPQLVAGDEITLRRIEMEVA